MSNRNKNIKLWAVLALIVGAIVYFESGKPALPNVTPGENDIPVNIAPVAAPSGTAPSAPASDANAKRVQAKIKLYPRAKEIVHPTGFINTPDTFRIADLVGKKVVLVDFWTYSCINCIRTTPYLNAWYEKYKDAGFEIVGMHTPEFEFEKNYENVAAAVTREGIHYPVVLDSERATWAAYQNRFWPHRYLIDIDGFIIYDQIGEGNYDAMEARIQKALKERAEVLGLKENVAGGTVEPDLGSDTPSYGATSPETYFGAARNEYFGSGVPGTIGIQSFGEPVSVNPSTLYLIGTWNITPEYAETPSSVGSGEVGSDRIDYRYRAKNVYLVAGSSNNVIEVEVLLDSKPVDALAKGEDIYYRDGRSYIKIQEKKLYKIIQDSTVGDHFLEFIILTPGLQAFAFTFG